MCSSAAVCVSCSAADGVLVHAVWLTPVVVQPLLGEFDDVCGHSVEEGSVVADEHQCGLDLLQVSLQPTDGREVEMVGGLVLTNNNADSRQANSSAQRRTLRSGSPSTVTVTAASLMCVLCGCTSSSRSH